MKDVHNQGVQLLILVSSLSLLLPLSQLNEVGKAPATLADGQVELS